MTRDDFWEWFGLNKSLLEDFISGKTEDYKIYNELSGKLKQYCEFLVPELTMNEENKYVLVISCDGMKQGIPFADKLTENLTIFENWIVIKFRQPGPMKSIPLNGLNLKRSSIFLEWRKSSGQKYHITFFVKGYSLKNANYELGTLLHMDHTIGEFNAMTKIDGVEIKKLGLFQSRKGLKTLDELKIELDNT